ncbi:thioredoxin-disulfide reductase [Victivallis vadensis]|uniref:Thioredoxin reductase n=1 Tax=Victivallis vadensis TaxID=172901 RepID=A0A848B0F3_9BACT|nr:thioredoxin-disulfide reductase [Victivallis vadensis]NMD87240.1 thioredoxin-disulfide reductase [Victivallis vadensis]
MQKEKLVIVGSGPAGYTAAIYAARANLNPLLYSGMLPGGLLTQTTEVENFPGFPESVLGFDLVTAMQAQAERFGTRIEYDAVEKFELTDGGIQKLILPSGDVVETEALIIATGASPRYLGLPNEERLRNHGVSACATCDGAFFKDVPVVVIGGGDSAMEEATFLTRFASKVYVVHRRDELRASPIMAERARANPKIEFVWSSVVEDILGQESVEGIRVKSLKTGETSEIACKGYFAALGHIPNTAPFKEFIQLDEHGFVVLSGDSSRTTLAGVFAAGDCADPHYRQAITAAGMGCKAGMDAERYLESKE